MSSLEYSLDAVNILGKFHSADTMLFVEGDEDVPFWEFLFETFTSLSIKVQAVYGKLNLEKYTEGIVAGTSDVLVAMDKDFSTFDQIVEHVNIIKTYGYSIENTIISSDTICKSIRSLGRIPVSQVSMQDIINWLNKFSGEIEPILLYDIANHIHQHGRCVAGCHCAKFMKSKSSHLIREKKIQDHLNDMGFSVTDQEKKDFLKAMEEVGAGVLDMIRGHFLFSATHTFVVTFIKHIRRKISVSHESMFATMMLSFERSFDKYHAHYEYYESALSKISIAA